MAVRRPLVNVGGVLYEMPAGDSLAADTYSASGGTLGRTTVDFGAFPGSSTAMTTVTGITGLTATSYVEVWVDTTTSTVDHTSGEHVVDPPRVIAGDFVAGTGFTVYAFSMDTNLHHGLYAVAYKIT